MRLNRRLILPVLLGGATLALSACGPTYPKCENDDHCAEKGEFCVNGLCQQCRDNSHCTGPGMICSGSRCVRKPGYCDGDIPCPGSQKCRDSECGPECLDDTVCGDTKQNYCRSGSCIPRPRCGEGAINPMCPPGQDCMAGNCQVKIASCPRMPVYFDFDRYNIRADQRGTLDGLAHCMKGDASPSVQVGGHCDERGTEEYNMNLGQQRADAVRRYLTNSGVVAEKLSSISYGENSPVDGASNESAWRKNRRTEFQSR